MELKPIATKAEYKAALVWVDEQFDTQIPPHTPAGEKLRAVLQLIQQYEDIHYPVALPTQTVNAY
ncbi:MAG: hypothetical protein EOP52_02800 [Sphingobacteriales bacterium]|nr:MAG: hypothetical protein EOP52_02800 [Sphingobacteriales bacterium]